MSDRRTNANRQNAKKSTGPRTGSGKAASRLNATKHGIISGLHVLPVIERQQDWEKHLDQILADVKPVGYLEISLAERVALFLWRLGRVARYEREVAALRQESVVEDLQEARRFAASPKNQYEHPDEARTLAQLAKDEVVLLEGFLELPDEAELTADHATTLISSIEGAAEVDVYADDFPSFPGIPEGAELEKFRPWTAGLVRGALRVIAIFAAEDLEDLYAKALNEARVELAVVDDRRKKLAKEIDRYRRQRLLPGSDDIDKVSRYETHLERCLYRTFHELQRLQARRAGAIAPPVAVDGDVSQDQ
jgi:hypothetical protein